MDANEREQDGGFTRRLRAAAATRFAKKKRRKGWEPARWRKRRTERNWGPRSFLSFGHASLLLRPIPQITNSFALFPSFLGYLCYPRSSLSRTRPYANHDNADRYYNRLGLRSRNYVRRTYFLDDHRRQTMVLLLVGYDLADHRRLFFLIQRFLRSHSAYLRSRLAISRVSS